LLSSSRSAFSDSFPLVDSYLNYLLYFKSPRYSRFLQYPQCLHHLSLLTAPGETGKSFRTAFKEQPLMAQELAGKQVAHWAGWRERNGSSGAEPKEEETATSGNDEGDKKEGQ
jgi:mediator of RNA polymerase II transcription subunit 31